MKGMNLHSVIKKSVVCYMSIEGETVIGTFFTDGFGAFTGVHFRSSICPNFIKQDNAAANETEESGMTGFCAEVTDIKMRWNEDNSRELYVSFDEGKIFRRVHVLTIEGGIITDTYGILPTKH
jgi:hypothetical protein